METVSVEHDYLFFKPNYNQQEIDSIESKFENERGESNSRDTYAFFVHTTVVRGFVFEVRC